MTTAETKTTKKPLVDLNDLDTVAASNKGMRFELLSPRDQSGTGIFITVLGRDGDAFREVVRENVDAANRRGQMARAKGKQITPQTVAEAEAEAIDLLIVCTVGWENMVVGGETLDFNVPNAKMVYNRFPWIRKQVDDAIGDMEGFMKT